MKERRREEEEKEEEEKDRHNRGFRSGGGKVVWERKMDQPPTRDWVVQRLVQYRSPDQIAGRLGIEQPPGLRDPSWQSIERWIRHARRKEGRKKEKTGIIVDYPPPLRQPRIRPPSHHHSPQGLKTPRLKHPSATPVMDAYLYRLPLE